MVHQQEEEKFKNTSLYHSLASARYCRPVIQPAVRHCIDWYDAHTVLWFWVCIFKHWFLLVTVPSNRISAWKSFYRSRTTVHALSCDIHGKRPSLTCRWALEIARHFWHCVPHSIHFIIIINNMQHSIWHSETWHLATRGPRKCVDVPQFCTQTKQEKKV